MKRFGRFLILALIFGAINLASIPAMHSQTTPFDAAKRMAGISLDGDWKNVNARSRALARIEIAGLKVHPYGSCSPTPCDWGISMAQPFASRVEGGDVGALLVSTTTSFDTSILTISLEPDGRLRVQLFTHFTDASRRRDYVATDYFQRTTGN